MRAKDIYPINSWEIVENNFDINTNSISETVFSLGNGYIGMRGNFEEGYNGPLNTSFDGTYINGFFEKEPITYGEIAYGYAKYNETMLNVTNGKIIKIYICGEEFSLFSGTLHDYKRTLDMKNGILKREMVWESCSGKKIIISIIRLVSLVNKNIAAIDYEITPLNFDGEIKIVSSLDGDVKNLEESKDPRIGAALKGNILDVLDKECSGSFGLVFQRTKGTEFYLMCGMENQLKVRNSYSLKNIIEEKKVSVEYTIDAKKDEKIVLSKYISYFTSKEYPPYKELRKMTEESLIKAKNDGFESLLNEQYKFLYEFWENSNVEIDGDEEILQGMRFNIFHLLQSCGRDGLTSISAKGLTGEGYGGHYFWDTEIFIFPFFLYTNPDISKSLLMYRYNTLDKARERAREMSHKKGALFPWRTIDGEECSAYYPAGTAQYHINADIAYAIKKYMECTDDIDFLIKYGAEMIFETVRIWMDIGFFNPHLDNKFCINGVTGPDEYTAIVNNNLYTNSMARMHLKFAFEVYEFLNKKYRSQLEEICSNIGLSFDEVLMWEKAYKNMYIPYEDKLKMHPQDDSFLNKKLWNFEETPKENYPLLLHYHPLVIYRHQVLKQADVLLAEFLLWNEFDNEDIKRDFDYYEKITTHDSSLSSCIHSIMACYIGYYDKAYDYFLRTARMDLDNLQGNSDYGAHMACMGGTWMCLIFGFGGLRTDKKTIKFNPYLPYGWKSYSFKINFGDCKIKIAVYKKYTEYKLLNGEKLTFYHKSKRVTIKKGEKVEI